MKSRMKPALRAVPAAQVQLSLNVQGVLRDVQQAFYGLCVNAGQQVLAAMMEADRVALCGTKNVPDPRAQGRAWRHDKIQRRAGRPAPRHHQAPGTQPGAWRAGATHLCVGRPHTIDVDVSLPMATVLLGWAQVGKSRRRDRDWKTDRYRDLGAERTNAVPEVFLTSTSPSTRLLFAGVLGPGSERRQ